MRRITRPKRPARQSTSRSHSLLAPTRGWYVGENIADAKKGAALILDNWFPLENKIRLRRGKREHATGLTGTVASLFTYESGAVEKMFAVAGGEIHDVSSAGAVGSPVYTGLTADEVQTALMTTSGGVQFAMVVNGADTRVLYDGSTWGTTPAITGVASSALSDVWVYANRAFFVEKETLNAWYLPVDSVGGAAVKFPLNGVFQLGGSLLAGTRWSREDAGVGLDDACVFLSTNGEVAIYTGLDPAGSDWRLAGVYRIGRPLGKRCFMQAGGDVAILTEDGLVPLSQAINLAEAALAETAVSRPIAPAWRDAVKARDGLTGWQVKVWKRESMALVNLPQPLGDSGTQFVANVTTAAWCRYRGWSAACFEIFDNRLFFGTKDGRVIEAEIGGDDEGLAYSGAVMWPYDDFKQPAAVKVLQMVRPMMESRVPIAPVVTAQFDYVSRLPLPPPAPVEAATGALWDVARWDEAVWPGGLKVYSEWQGVAGFGTSVAMALQMTTGTTSAADIFLNRLDLIYDAGDVLA